jgi:hypothetical protein
MGREGAEVEGGFTVVLNNVVIAYARDLFDYSREDGEPETYGRVSN